ncbi:MAG: hypothetical protein DI551_11420 [Micavibrio aeruginosavorus]|uniref:Uncharacterized protein n=1 Tax=Micavibrio aeruginosavorus TaxID=349221 RepID=A0A2W5MUD5_9BACT|nr:MAG: hypothetical protein DI551_11420 [Micavibrio aeruginosavorus]
MLRCKNITDKSLKTQYCHEVAVLAAFFHFILPSGTILGGLMSDNTKHSLSVAFGLAGIITAATAIAFATMPADHVPPVQPHEEKDISSVASDLLTQRQTPPQPVYLGDQKSHPKMAF